MPMPGHHNALNATAAIAVAYDLGMPPDDDPQGARGLRRRQAPLHPHRRVERRRRSSTTTATTRSRSPPCCAPRAPRRRGQVIAVVQPHRYTRLASLFDQFATCFNDADTVIVAPTSIAAGEAADRRRRPRQPGAGPEGARPPPCAAARRPADSRPRPRASPSRAITSCASAPAPSRNGPTRCRRTRGARRGGGDERRSSPARVP